MSLIMQKVHIEIHEKRHKKKSRGRPGKSELTSWDFLITKCSILTGLEMERERLLKNEEEDY